MQRPSSLVKVLARNTALPTEMLRRTMALQTLIAFIATAQQSLGRSQCPNYEFNRLKR